MITEADRKAFYRDQETAKRKENIATWLRNNPEIGELNGGKFYKIVNNNIVYVEYQETNSINKVMSTYNLKKYLNSGYRIRRQSWKKGDFIFCDKRNTVRDQDWNGYQTLSKFEGLEGNDWCVVY